MLETVTMASDDESLALYLFLACVTLGSLLLVFAQPPFGQDLDYHNFADQRVFLGIENFADVVSSLGFVIVGAVGARLCRSYKPGAIRAAWSFFFVGVMLVGPGSVVYHLRPCNATLVLDRLPMSIAFMGLMMALLGEYLGVRFCRICLAPALILGLMSVLYWHWFDDLRLYAWVQFFPLVVLPVVALLFRKRHTGQGFLIVACVCYLLAKVAESYDRDIFALTHDLVSGHTLKHLLAASAVIAVLFMLKHSTRDGSLQHGGTRHGLG